ncbi:MAG: hypothetical protein HRT69_16015 [Flavobacteriaceae bacterium]|nr:hypothetical protein [Flavobacteriaceae bacterium]
MTKEEKGILKQHIGGQGDDYAKVITERLEAAGILNKKNNFYKTSAVRQVWALNWSNVPIEAELYKLYHEREAEFQAKLNSLKGKTKKSEADTSDSK